MRICCHFLGKGLLSLWLFTRLTHFSESCHLELHPLCSWRNREAVFQPHLPEPVRSRGAGHGIGMAGGEVTAVMRGKPCPGSGRILQVPLGRPLFCVLFLLPKAINPGTCRTRGAGGRGGSPWERGQPGLRFFTQNRPGPAQRRARRLPRQLRAAGPLRSGNRGDASQGSVPLARGWGPESQHRPQSPY